MEEFNVTETVASLGLALYVLGCMFHNITTLTKADKNLQMV